MGIFDSTITRVYQCSDCSAMISCVEKVSDDWKTQCPFCEKHTLFLHSGKVNLSVFIDPSVPKTFGTQAEVNTQRAIKEGTYNPSKKKPKPWWRKNKKKIDYRVLKNPTNYIKTGNI